MGHERYAGWLAIPYLDRNKKPLSVRFRCLQDHQHEGHGKYMSLTGEPARAFNVGAIHRAVRTTPAVIHITEGELDALVLERIGLPAIAIPGASGWQAHHRRMVAGFDRIWVWGDPDPAGAEFNRKVLASLRSAKAVRLRDGDVTDTYRKRGAEALLDLIKESE